MKVPALLRMRAALGLGSPVEFPVEFAAETEDAMLSSPSVPPREPTRVGRF